MRGGGATPGNGSPAGKGAGATAAPGRNFHENVAVGERHGNKKLLDLYRVDRSKTAVLGEGMTRCVLGVSFLRLGVAVVTRGYMVCRSVLELLGGGGTAQCGKAISRVMRAWCMGIVVGSEVASRA